MKPLFVDLDGTLLYNDSVQEVLCRLLFSQPIKAIFSLWILLTQGKALFKAYLAKNFDLNDQQWPINHELLNFLKIEKAKGRKVILLTACQQKIAESIVEPLNIFDQVEGSLPTRNFKGNEKLIWIKQNHPNQEFSYAGNGPDDYIVWEACQDAIVTNPSAIVFKKAKTLCKNITLIANKPKKISIIGKLLRIHQYSKNLLLFIPLLLSGNLLHGNLFFNVILAFIAFSATASASYILNDLLDITHDRLHANKKLRPLAAGYINTIPALGWALSLLIIAIVITCFLPSSFAFTLLSYFVLTVIYSLWLKHVAILDVFVLAGLYLIRIIAGSAATGIILSQWLFAFALFFFLSLGFLKRYIEISQLNNDVKKINGRNYDSNDRLLVKISGICLGYISILIFALYLNSNSMLAIYQYPNGLWLAAVLLLYWLSYIWHQALHKHINHDPLEFALQNKTSLGIGIAIILIILFCQGVIL